jgi:hypothetical protein
MIRVLRKFGSWILDIVLVRPPHVELGPEIPPDPPPWDVPLDQTIEGVRWEDERHRFERDKA